MSWSMAEVCRGSGVTSRTLRHYHHIGLLAPESVGPGGQRRYGDRELRRLQRILVMRELGLGLADIRRALDSEHDEVAALRRHLFDLEAERDRLGSLIETVRRTVDALEGNDMTTIRPEEFFTGFDVTYYDDRVRTQWPEQWEEAGAAGRDLTPEEGERMRAHGRVVDHYEGVCRMWTPDADAFVQLGRVYAEPGPWREVYEKVAPGLADYQCEAMEDYARHVLGQQGSQ